MYVYCGNNPVKREDEEGCSWSVIAAKVIVGGVLGAVAGGISARQRGENLFVGILIGGLTGAATGIVSMFAGIKTAAQAIGSFLAYAAVGAGGNALTQYTNYRLQDKTKRESLPGNTQGSTVNGQSQAVADAAFQANTFGEYLDTKSLGRATFSNVLWGSVGMMGGVFLDKFLPGDVASDAMWAVDVTLAQFAFDLEGAE